MLFTCGISLVLFIMNITHLENSIKKYNSMLYITLISLSLIDAIFVKIHSTTTTCETI